MLGPTLRKHGPMYFSMRIEQKRTAGSSSTRRFSSALTVDSGEGAANSYYAAESNRHSVSAVAQCVGRVLHILPKGQQAITVNAGVMGGTITQSTATTPCH